MDKKIEKQDILRENADSILGAWEATCQRMEYVRGEVNKILNGLYWLGIKMSNNRDKFKDSEIEYVDSLYTEFEELVDRNDEILRDLHEMEADLHVLTEAVEQNEVRTMCNKEFVSKLLQRQDLCHIRMQECLAMDVKLQGRLAELSHSLYSRQDKSLWTKFRSLWAG